MLPQDRSRALWDSLPKPTKTMSNQTSIKLEVTVNTPAEYSPIMQVSASVKHLGDDGSVLNQREESFTGDVSEIQKFLNSTVETFSLEITNDDLTRHLKAKAE